MKERVSAHREILPVRIILESHHHQPILAQADHDLEGQDRVDAAGEGAALADPAADLEAAEHDAERDEVGHPPQRLQADHAERRQDILPAHFRILINDPLIGSLREINAQRHHDEHDPDQRSSQDQGQVVRHVVEWHESGCDRVFEGEVATEEGYLRGQHDVGLEAVGEQLEERRLV